MSAPSGVSLSKKDLAERARVQTRLKHVVAFLACSAFQEIVGSVLVNEHSFADGWFFHEFNNEVITEGQLVATESLMRQWIQEGSVQEDAITREEVIRHFERDPVLYKDKLQVLRMWRADPVPILRCGKDHVDYRLFRTDTNPKRLEACFQCNLFEGGMLICFRDPWNPDVADIFSADSPFPPLKDRNLLFDTCCENEDYGHRLDMDNVGALNEKVYNKSIKDIVLVDEARHERNFVLLVNKLVEAFPHKRILCISGPSSSGKTSSAIRISNQLRAAGFQALLIGMDNFYKHLSEVPVDSKGNYDFEVVESLDIADLADRLVRLCRGEAVPSRTYDFLTHEPMEHPEKPWKLGDKEIIIVEGIHGLNPAFTDLIGGGDRVTRVFVSALTQMNIDNSIHVSTSDNRLLRRILRDYNFRGYSADVTLNRWGMVRAQENIQIFPDSIHADYFLNTSLIYEMAVLANYCRTILAEVRSDKPDINEEAERLLTMLNLFYPLDDTLIPKNSIMREFTGGSVLDY